MRQWPKGDGDNITGGRKIIEVRRNYGKFQLAFIGYLLYARFKSQHFKIINSFKVLKSPMMKVLLVIIFSKEK